VLSWSGSCCLAFLGKRHVFAFLATPRPASSSEFLCSDTRKIPIYHPAPHHPPPPPLRATPPQCRYLYQRLNSSGVTVEDTIRNLSSTHSRTIPTVSARTRMPSTAIPGGRMLLTSSSRA